jgi:hypothetical protein
VTVDPPCNPKAITFPIDAKLVHAAIKVLNRPTRAHSLKLRQSYLRIAKRAAMMAGGYAQVRHFKHRRRQLGLLRTRLGRLQRRLRQTKATRRMHTDAPPTLALSATEIGLLDRLVNDKPRVKPKTLSHYLIKVARLRRLFRPRQRSAARQYRKWRGLPRLTDIALAPLSKENLWVIESSTGALRPARIPRDRSLHF